MVDCLVVVSSVFLIGIEERDGIGGSVVVDEGGLHGG